MVLSGRLALVAVLAAVAVATVAPSAIGVLLATWLILVLGLIDTALAGAVRQLSFDRSGDTTVRLGETATVTLTMHNHGRRRVRGLLRDAWPPSAGVATDRFRVDAPAGGWHAFDVRLHPTRRGDRTADRVTVRSMGPLGLAGRQASHAAAWTVRVLPPFHARRHLPARLARLRELDGRSAVLTRGAGTEFDSLREYVVGDDTRSIDWRATARRGDVVVRTWRPERDRHVLVVLDTGRTSAARVGDAPRLDAAMDAALLLGTVAARAGDRVELLAYDRRVRAAVERPAATEILPRMVNALATVEPELLETDHRGLAAEIRARAGRHALVVLITGIDSGTVEQGLLPLVNGLTQRHTVLVASVADPRLAEMAAARENASAVYRAAAAEHDRQGRDQVADLLRQRGAHVVDAAPGELPPALADAYLDLKAAGQL
ncbi:DUF58 domain-containing protein [Actinobacteria bacterium YIM 96077]|uniref:DUF58 domain-containing protein n=1 Tax=Phytoactinopolyspora halophila TaxID=1981511 RepID=A0A329R6P5_9ACTN|nr:DUF58 domain-containing protein [Phytoactinopolyspora halophila]AYY12058.1 DUF58 domain-containing protein [Actinobacteria bacterium YIM 96077]RAW18708.1 DUF58 domain-containing protein [Phytoactinopolyspora halophila]